MNEKMKMKEKNYFQKRLKSIQEERIKCFNRAILESDWVQEHTGIVPHLSLVGVEIPFNCYKIVVVRRTYRPIAGGDPQYMYLWTFYGKDQDVDPDEFNFLTKAEVVECMGTLLTYL